MVHIRVRRIPLLIAALALALTACPRSTVPNDSSPKTFKLRVENVRVTSPIVIASAVCDGWFNDLEFPPYRAAYDLCGTEYADFDHREEDLAVRERLRDLS